MAMNNKKVLSYDFMFYHIRNSNIPTISLPILDDDKNKNIFYHALSPDTLLVFGEGKKIRKLRDDYKWNINCVNYYVTLINKRDKIIIGSNHMDNLKRNNDL